MKIHKIRLENIRSYISEEIFFPEGKVLLWGNIGSGKSSVLYAIDFVLFGLQRSDLAGASLLRNGADEGSVEFFFSLDGKEYVLKRVLKRTKNGVVQDAGYIICNGIKEDKTALELKQMVLDLLHYPKDLLTKNKTLIYRYTVYTPQEEMKTILLGPKEERLDTLRKVFGVDKYKRVKENTKIIISDLKEKKKSYEGATIDLPEKILEKEKKELEKKSFEQKLIQILPQLEELQIILAEKKAQMVLLEQQREELSLIKSELALCTLDFTHTQDGIEKNIEREKNLHAEIDSLQKENLLIPENIKENLVSLDAFLLTSEKELRQILNNIQELKTKKTHALHMKQKVESLNMCPTCFQEVSLDHKQKIYDSTFAEVSLFEKEQSVHEKKQIILEANIIQTRLELEALRKRENEASLIALKVQHLQKKQEERMLVQKRMQELRIHVDGLQIKIKELRSRVEALHSLDAHYISSKKELEQTIEYLQQMNLEKMQWELSLKHIANILQNLEQEIEKKLQIREKKEYVNKIQFWLQEHFIPLMDLMEKNILFKVHAEFNNLFEKWFSLLIDNQTLYMSLDEEYSPRIHQNGYEIEYEFLSGGEKTAGALAYRLALNQVINTLNVGLKTKDLLLLDEPTDGFSSEQLDRLKILMDEIRIPQIIIVSHEAEIECFVDHIIRFEKREHITKVIF